MIQENFPLKTYNTFGLDIRAKMFFNIEHIDQIATVFKQNPDIPKLIIGGGSNVLFCADFEGLVLKMSTKGIVKTKEDEDFVFLNVQAGEIWHEFVVYCIENNYAGVENLSLIPGTVGAAPMQNIGAYGVEIKEVIESVEVMDKENFEKKVFSNKDCHFAYRESIFKNTDKDRYIITAVNFRLRKKPVFNMTYGAIQDTLKEMNIDEISIKAISEVVCHIRKSKLPDPAVIGNAGSFFKNPEVGKLQYEDLKLRFPDIPAYPVSETQVKIPAGWLIEQAGWKGKRIGEIGVHPKQALVLVNYGEGSGKEILALAQEIQRSVAEKFGIGISPEINII